jgi:hypothetical protein
MQRSLIIRLTFLAMFGFISACSTQLSVANDVFQTPHVNLKGEEFKRYQNDAQMCQQEIIQLYKTRVDSRNKNIEFRECLIKKGHVLLS